MLADKTILKQYELKKQALITQLKRLNAERQPIHLNKQTSNLFRCRKVTTKGIDVKAFNEIIAIDKDNLVVHVEGMTTYETLVQACLQYQCLPAVVPELKTITVGGAFAGCGIESSSFKYGLMHETVVEFEALLSDGRVVLCRPDNEYHDLFTGFPNSYGTLGYALRLSLKLYSVKPYVKLTHTSFTDPESYFDAIKNMCKHERTQENIQFVEGVVFGKNDLYLTTAQFVEQVPYVSDYTFMKIYYHAIKKYQEDYLTINDYIWRWDTDWFWCSNYFYVQNPIIRYLVGKKRLNSIFYWRIHKFISNHYLGKKMYNIFYKKAESIVQDVQIPVENAEKFLSFYQQDIEINPVWICPTQSFRNDLNYDLYPLNPDQLYINFGFWGLKPAVKKEDGFYNRLIEKKTHALSGVKSLYSTVYYTKTEFNLHYNNIAYDYLKNKYDRSNYLRTLYEKCVEK